MKIRNWDKLIDGLVIWQKPEDVDCTVILTEDRKMKIRLQLVDLEEIVDVEQDDRGEDRDICGYLNHWVSEMRRGLNIGLVPNSESIVPTEE